MQVEHQNEISLTLPYCEMCFLLTETAHLFNRALNVSIIDNRLGLTPSALRALFTVIHFQGMGLNHIADQMGLEPVSLIVHINWLIKLGLVERQQDPLDKRRRPLYPTHKAFETVKELDQSFEKLYLSMVREMSVEEIACLTEIFSKVRGNMLRETKYTLRLPRYLDNK